eukprot:2233188-Alexandrium_andersonii.AAC.1
MTKTKSLAHGIQLQDPAPEPAASTTFLDVGRLKEDWRGCNEGLGSIVLGFFPFVWQGTAPTPCWAPCCRSDLSLGFNAFHGPASQLCPALPRWLCANVPNCGSSLAPFRSDVFEGRAGELPREELGEDRPAWDQEVLCLCLAAGGWPRGWRGAGCCGKAVAQGQRGRGWQLRERPGRARCIELIILRGDAAHGGRRGAALASFGPCAGCG